MRRYLSRHGTLTSFQAREIAVAIPMLVALAILYLGIFHLIPIEIGLMGLYVGLVVIYFVSPREDLKSKMRVVPR